MNTTRRDFLQSSFAASDLALTAPHLCAANDPIAPYRTPYKYPDLILKATGNKSDFDEKSVDDPIVFRANGRFHMLYIGFDGTGYQTGLAVSADLVHWKREALVGPAIRHPPTRNTISPSAPYLRDKNLHGPGGALKIDGEYLAAVSEVMRPRRR